MITSTDIIKDFLAQKGYTVQSVEEHGNDVNTYHVVCKRGHKRTLTNCTAYKVKECPFCIGRKHTKQQVVDLVENSDMIVKDIEHTVDKHGNEVVNRVHKVTYQCDKGHVRTRTLATVLKNAESGTLKCFDCEPRKAKFKRRNKDIISFVLDYNNVPYTVNRAVHEDIYSPTVFQLVDDNVAIVCTYGKRFEKFKLEDSSNYNKVVYIPESKSGMKVVWIVKSELLPNLDFFDITYKNKVIEIFDTTSKSSSGIAMDYYQELADMYIKYQGIPTTEDCLYTIDMLQRAYAIAYGIPLKEFRKFPQYRATLERIWKGGD